MIKNFLYSLFLHGIFALLLYLSFKLTFSNELIEINRGISVGIANFETKKHSDLPAIPTEKKTEKKPEEIKKKPKIAKKIKSKKIEKPTIKPEITKKEEFKKIDPEIIEKPKVEQEISKKDLKIQEDDKKIEDDTKEISETKLPALSSDEQIADDLENLDLSAREKFNIKSQLASCFYKVSLNEKIDIELLVKVRILKDGTIEFNKENFVDFSRYEQEKSYKKMVDNVVASLEFCSPLRNLPLEKYDVWQEFNIKFSGK